MNIFRLFQSKKFMKICSKTHQIAPFKRNFSGKGAPEPSSKRLAQPPKKLALLGKSCIRPWTLLLRNLFQEMLS